MTDAPMPGAPAFDAAFRDKLAELLRWRRDVRRFRATPVPPALPPGSPALYVAHDQLAAVLKAAATPAAPVNSATHNAAVTIRSVRCKEANHGGHPAAR